MIRKIVAVFTLLMITSIPAMSASWEFDKDHSTIQFKVKHLMVTNVVGVFEGFDGLMTYDPNYPTKSIIEVQVDASSVNTDNQKRDDHLRSPDFFDVENHPEITFRSTKIEQNGEHEFLVYGDLTILEITREIVLHVEGPTPPVEFMGRTHIGVSAWSVINRSDYGMTWNKTLDKGGVVVGEEVKIFIDAELLAKN